MPPHKININISNNNLKTLVCLKDDRDYDNINVDVLAEALSLRYYINVKSEDISLANTQCTHFCYEYVWW